MHKKISINLLLVIIVNIFLSATIAWANPEKSALAKVDRKSILVEGVAAAATLSEETIPPPSASEMEIETDAKVGTEHLPLVKTVHKNALDLLCLSFVPKPMDLPSYIPMLQHIGVRFNWFGLVREWYQKQHQNYEGGADLHFRSDIQLSIDIGYECYKPTNLVYGNHLKYQSKGKYGIGALRYVMTPNHLTNAYVGIAYGQSYFSLITFRSDCITLTPQDSTAHFIKLILGSELKLISNSGLYGGMLFGIARLLRCTKSEQVSNYVIPGYGAIMTKTILIVTPYLKWNISFLEKKIVI